jgi:hypothetical protein
MASYIQVWYAAIIEWINRFTNWLCPKAPEESPVPAVMAERDALHAINALEDLGHSELDLECVNVKDNTFSGLQLPPTPTTAEGEQTQEPLAETSAAAQAGEVGVLAVSASRITALVKYHHDTTTLLFLGEATLTSSPALNELAKEITASKISRNMEQFLSCTSNLSISTQIPDHSGIQEASNSVAGDVSNSPTTTSDVKEVEDAPLSPVHSPRKKSAVANANTQAQNADGQEVAQSQRAPRHPRFRVTKMTARQQESLLKHYTRVGKSSNSSRGNELVQSPASSSEGRIDADARRTANKWTSESTKEKRVPVWQKTTESFRAKMVLSRRSMAKVHPTGEYCYSYRVSNHHV